MLDRDRAGTPKQNCKMAEYLATINLSAVDKWDYELKTLPRPTGRSARAIVTKYDVGRATSEFVLDNSGNVWSSDFGELFISKLDPKTLKLTEYPTKNFKPDAPVGNLDLEFDKEGKLWFDTMYQGALGTIDPEAKFYPLPPDWNDNRVRLNFVSLRHNVDGKASARRTFSRLDLATYKWERFHPTDQLAPGRYYSVYQVISDSKNGYGWPSLSKAISAPSTPRRAR